MTVVGTPQKNGWLRELTKPFWRRWNVCCWSYI